MIKQLFFGTICTVLGIIVSWATFIFILDGDIRGITQSAILLFKKTDVKLTPIEVEHINHLKDSDLILSAGELLGHIGSFYATIIVILITLLTLVTALTLFFVKSSAEDRAEKKAKEIALSVIEEKFNPKLQQFDESIQKISDSNIKEILTDQLHIKLFDSVSFAQLLDAKLYKQVEDAIEDSLGTSGSEIMRVHLELVSDNLKMKERMGEINLRIDNIDQLYNDNANNSGVIELDQINEDDPTADGALEQQVIKESIPEFAEGGNINGN